MDFLQAPETTGLIKRLCVPGFTLCLSDNRLKNSNKSSHAELDICLVVVPRAATLRLPSSLSPNETGPRTNKVSLLAGKEPTDG